MPGHYSVNASGGRPTHDLSMCIPRSLCPRLLRTQNSHLDGNDLDEPAREEMATNGVTEPETFGNGVVFKATGKKAKDNWMMKVPWSN